jgi:hypothetical protein
MKMMYCLAYHKITFHGFPQTFLIGVLFGIQGLWTGLEDAE